MPIAAFRVALALALMLVCVPVGAQETPTLPRQQPKPGALEELDRLKIKRPATPLEPLIVFTVQPEDTIFPSLVIASATIKHDESERTEFELGDIAGLIGVGVVSPADHTPVTVTISCPDVMEPSTFKGQMNKGASTYAISPKIKWKYKELMKSRQQMPVDVTFKVRIGDMAEKEHVRTCTLRTINDCPLGFISGDMVSDTHWAFAAYVNEDHPWVDKILKEALGTGVVKQFIGYQANDPDVVLKQVYAVWRVMQNRGISYSDIARVSAAQGQTMFSQHVRFLDECIENKQANCIDGTVMLASVLRKIGINPRIVFVPGHAFLAFDLDGTGEELVGLETTIMGAARKEDFDRTKKLRELLIDAKSYDEASWDSFQAALKVGCDRLKQDLPKLTSETDTTPEYWLISIGEAREVGVRPIPYLPDLTKKTDLPKDETPKEEAPKRELKRIR